MHKSRTPPHPALSLTLRVFSTDLPACLAVVSSANNSDQHLQHPSTGDTGKPAWQKPRQRWTRWTKGSSRGQQQASGLSPSFPVMVKAAAFRPCCYSSASIQYWQCIWERGQHPTPLHTPKNTLCLECTSFCRACHNLAAVHQPSSPLHSCLHCSPLPVHGIGCALCRNQIEPGGRFAPEAGRYHLYISYACPWACRTVAAMHLKVGPTGSLCVRRASATQ